MRQSSSNSQQRPEVRQENPERDPIGTLAYAQRRFWFLHESATNKAAYNIPLVLKFRGELDLRALKEAINDIVSRHQILHSSYTNVDGAPAVVVGRPRSQELRVVTVPADVPVAVLHELIQQELKRPFDLEQTPLLRAVAVKTSPEECLLVITVHHIAADEWSLALLVEELIAIYGALTAACPPPAGPTLQYYQCAEQQGPSLESRLDTLRYWKQQLKGVSALELPTSRPRTGKPSGEGATYRCFLADSLSAGLLEFSARENSTLFMVMAAAFAVLLRKYTGQTSIVIGTPITTRARKEMESVVGCFLNSLPLRLNLREDTSLKDVLREVRAVTLEAFLHQEVPFEQVVEELEPEREWTRNPLFQVMLVVDHATAEEWHLPGLAITREEADTPGAKFDLVLFVREKRGRIQCGFEFSLDLFEEPMVRRMSGHLQTVLQAMIADLTCRVDEVSVLSAPERQRWVEWNRTARAYPGQSTVPELFLEQVRRAPDQKAVICGDQHLTRQELNACAEHLAGKLVSLGVGPDVPVGICADRSLELVIGLMAILKAGGAYVPLEANLPQQRVERIAGDIGFKVVLAQSRTAHILETIDSRILLIDDAAAQNGAVSSPWTTSLAQPEHLAYVIYTSGSTGTPKGAMNSHRAVCNRLLWMQEAFGLVEDDRVLHKTPFGFDVSVWELFWPLIFGVPLVIAAPGGHRDVKYLQTIIAEHRITTIHFVPSMLESFVDEADPFRCASLRRVICSGEALTADLQRRFFERFSCELHNLYGPTETAVDVTWWPCRHTEQAGVPIGKAIANTQVYVLDNTYHPCPAHLLGEIYIGGMAVGRGYWSLPDVTAASFIPDPLSGLPGARMYRTGDLGRYREDGNIEYMGRRDHQVKVRGNRIELGEIEAQLSEHPQVRMCAVIVPGGNANITGITAYVVPRGAADQADTFPLHNSCIASMNRSETEFMYKEIFEAEIYRRHGLEIYEDSCVLDVGANIGMFTLYAAERCPLGRVYAFEPIPDLYRKLTINSRLTEADVRCFPFGLGATESYEEFTFYPGNTIMSGISSHADPHEAEQVVRTYLENQRAAGTAEAAELLATGETIIAERVRNRKFRCRIRSLSGVLRELKIGYVDLLKVDVERSEWSVLEGVAPEDWPKIAQIVIEVHDQVGEDKDRVQRTRQFLEARGYATWVDEDEFLKGTGLFNVYGKRHDARTGRIREVSPGPANPPVSITEEKLRRYLRMNLPEYMVPSRIILAGDLPLTASGKLDRRALDQMPAQAFSRKTSGVPPANETEEALAAIWKELLGLESPGVNDNFFLSGGHSLKAVRLRWEIEKRFGTNIPLPAIFERPTIRQLSEMIAEYKPKDPSPRQAGSIRRIVRTGEFPLSFNQEGRLFREWWEGLHKVQGRSNNATFGLRLTGQLNPKALTKALDSIVARHEIFRTTYSGMRGILNLRILAPVFDRLLHMKSVWKRLRKLRGSRALKSSFFTQTIVEDAHVQIQALDFRGSSSEDSLAKIHELVIEEDDRAFNREQAPMLRATLVRLSDDVHLLVLTTNHLTCDAWSLDVLTEELVALYDGHLYGTEKALPEPAIQYVDFSQWQRDRLQGSVLEDMLSYWRKSFADGEVLPKLPLPFANLTGAMKYSRGVCETIALDGPLYSQITSLAEQAKVTLNAVVLTSLFALLHLYTGRRSVGVWTFFANRLLPETQGLIGWCSNSHVLNMNVESSFCFDQLLKRVNDALLGAQEHQEIPFGLVMSNLMGSGSAQQLQHGMHEGPYVFFHYVTESKQTWQAKNLVIQRESLSGERPTFHLVIAAVDHGNELRITMRFSEQVYKQEDMAQMLSDFREILSRMVGNSGCSISHAISSRLAANADRAHAGAQDQG